MYTQRRPYKKLRRFNLVTLLVLVVLALAVYGGIRFLPHIWQRWQAQSVVDNAVYRLFTFSHHTGPLRGEEDQKLREDLMGKLRALGIKDPDMTVEFGETDKEVSVTATYTVVVTHPWVERKTTLTFRPSASTSKARPFN